MPPQAGAWRQTPLGTALRQVTAAQPVLGDDEGANGTWMGQLNLLVKQC
jgi:hypothetical protein